MHLCMPRISHAITAMVLDLSLYTKDPDDVVDNINIFLLLDLLASAYSEVSLIARRCDTFLGGGSVYGHTNGGPSDHMGSSAKSD